MGERQNTTELWFAGRTSDSAASAPSAPRQKNGSGWIGEEELETRLAKEKEVTTTLVKGHDHRTFASPETTTSLTSSIHTHIITNIMRDAPFVLL